MTTRNSKHHARSHEARGALLVLIGHYGSYAGVGAVFGVGAETISNWAGIKIPTKRAKDVLAAVEALSHLVPAPVPAVPK